MTHDLSHYSAEELKHAIRTAARQTYIEALARFAMVEALVSHRPGEEVVHTVRDELDTITDEDIAAALDTYISKAAGDVSPALIRIVHLGLQELERRRAY